MATLQTLLAPDDSASSGQDRASFLTNKIVTAASALTFIPTLHPLALEVVSNALFYQSSLADPSASKTPGPPDSPLGVALQDVWVLLNSLLSHCPSGWSTRLFKVTGLIFQGRLAFTFRTFTFRTPIFRDTLHSGHLVFRTPYIQDILHSGHLTFRTPYIQDTLFSGHLTFRNLGCLTFRTPYVQDTFYIGHGTPYIQDTL
jgi:hypothetical protein